MPKALIYDSKGELYAAVAFQNDVDEMAAEEYYAARGRYLFKLVAAWSMETLISFVEKDTHYIKLDGAVPELLPFPAKPSSAHEWNFQAGQWQLSQTQLSIIRGPVLGQLDVVYAEKLARITYEGIVFNINDTILGVLKQYHLALLFNGDLISELGHRPEWPGVEDANGVFHKKNNFADEVTFIYGLIQTACLRRAGCFSRYTVHRQAVLALTTSQAVTAYNVTTGWEF